MAQIVQIGAMSLGGAALFGMSFLGFAVASGAPMHEVAIIGGLFQAPDLEELGSAGGERTGPAPHTLNGVRSHEQVLDAQRGVLSAFELPPSFSAEELHLVVDEVKARQAAQDARERALDEREATLEEREAVLSERLATLEDMKAALEAFERELDLQGQELSASQTAAAERKASAWNATAALFADGDVDEQAVRLQQFPPDEAAEILMRLKPSRARDLLAALPSPELWREYQDAYSERAE
jgi:flagellar motility protein MotE (MotC chaperone)